MQLIKIVDQFSTFHNSLSAQNVNFKSEIQQNSTMNKFSLLYGAIFATIFYFSSKII